MREQLAHWIGEAVGLLPADDGMGHPHVKVIRVLFVLLKDKDEHAMIPAQRVCFARGAHERGTERACAPGIPCVRERATRGEQARARKAKLGQGGNERRSPTGTGSTPTPRMG